MNNVSVDADARASKHRWPRIARQFYGVHISADLLDVPLSAATP